MQISTTISQINEQQRQKVSKAANSTSSQPPRHVQENSTQMETMKPRLSEHNTDALRRVLITMLWLDTLTC